MISDAIKEIRRRNYLNQTQFAQKVGVSQSAVSQWETGLTKPTSDQLLAISTAFHISIDELLTEDDSKPEPPKTEEAQILAKGVDKLPQEQRKQALKVVKAMFDEYSDYFKGEGDET